MLFVLRIVEIDSRSCFKSWRLHLVVCLVRCFNRVFSGVFSCLQVVHNWISLVRCNWIKSSGKTYQKFHRSLININFNLLCSFDLIARQHLKFMDVIRFQFDQIQTSVLSNSFKLFVCMIPTAKILSPAQVHSTQSASSWQSRTRNPISISSFSPSKLKTHSATA
jgi:hypothetical protein